MPAVKESFDAMAKRLGCDAILVTRDTGFAKAGETLLSADACQAYLKTRKRKLRPDQAKDGLARWAWLAVYYGVSPIIFLDLKRMSSIEIVLLIITTCAVLFCGWRVWVHSRALKPSIPQPEDPVAGIEVLFDAGYAERRWVHQTKR